MKKILYLVMVLGAQVVLQASEVHVKTLQEDTYSKELAEELDNLKRALADDECCDEFCKKWSNAEYLYDVDRCFDWSLRENSNLMVSENIAWAVHIQKALEKSSSRKRAMKVALVVQKRRTCKAAVLGSLLDLSTIYRQDVLAEWEEFFKKEPINIDKAMPDEYTIGELLDYQIRKHCSSMELIAKLFKFAHAAQPHRSSKDDVFLTLFMIYKDNPTALVALCTWIKIYSINIDRVIHPVSKKSIGHELDSAIQLPHCSNYTTKLAQCTQPYRGVRLD